MLIFSWKNQRSLINDGGEGIWLVSWPDYLTTGKQLPMQEAVARASINQEKRFSWPNSLSLYETSVTRLLLRLKAPALRGCCSTAPTAARAGGIFVLKGEMKQAVLQELQRIPGVGKRIAEDLWNLDIRSISDLKKRSPEELYAKLCALQGTQVDRCMLYVFRCAVYFASNKRHDPELLKWWNWKERK